VDSRAAGIRDRLRRDLDVLAVVGVGGTLGAAARFKVAEALPVETDRFPWATFWTNLVGSFAIGFVVVLLIERFPPTRYVRPFVASGVLGAFTTMSALSVETALLAKDGHVATAVTYSLATVVSGLLLASIGMATARLTPPKRRGGDR
jgi:CrcB protein